jgi:hypothetical protein
VGTACCAASACDLRIQYQLDEGLIRSCRAGRIDETPVKTNDKKEAQ